ncbi:MAG: DUF3617 domain-containing protein [Terracidiphilus sp.]
MRKTRIYIALGCCFLAMAIFAWAQANRKPGLWEMTSTMTWQQSPMPPGMTMPPGANSPFGGGPRTTQVCLTQAMIDKYGAPMPSSRNGQCQISNVSLKPTSMSADWICTGMMTGKGSLESSWSDPDHAIGKVHFVGTMQMGPNSRPIEYTMESSSVYKGPDCGSVQPMTMPAEK